MALATQCPHCHTTFRVASDQLKLRGGIVRCGACQRIFDGSAHLVDLDALAASKPAAPPAPETTPSEAAPPVYTLDFDATLDPLGILPKAESEARAQDPEPPHGDVLADAVDAAAASGSDLSAADDADGDASAAQESPQNPEPPHGDVLAHALDTVTESEPENVQDPERPHGDALAHALGAALDTDALPGADLPAPDAPAAGRARDPEPPHGDVLDHAVEAAAAPEPDVPNAPAPAAPPLSFAPQGRIEPSFDLPVDEELVAQALPGHEPYPEAPRDAAPLTAGGDTPSAALPLRASAGGMTPSEGLPAQQEVAFQAPKSARAKALDARTRRTKMTPTRIEAPKLRVPETDEPEFVKRSRKQEQSGRARRILMGVGAAVLLLVLAAQLVLNFRNVLAARHPGARPALGAACALLGCRVELPTQIDNLAIETGELSTLGPDTYSLNTLLRNQGSLVQAWPSIELELTDANDKPVLRRVFAPADYLPQGASAAAGFGAHSEQAVRLHFALTDLKPSGYHIAVFYP
jgi:predicted Zn finger-like uncharacterized protein